MVKLKDIAQACGVSAATVSRALNGLADPGKKNTAFILRTAKEMGYYPNAAARTLKTSRSYNIGILYEDRMDHEYFSLLLNGIRFAAENKGYDLTFIRRFPNSEEGNYHDRARRRNLDGVVVVQAGHDAGEAAHACFIVRYDAAHKRPTSCKSLSGSTAQSALRNPGKPEIGSSQVSLSRVLTLPPGSS